MRSAVVCLLCLGLGSVCALADSVGEARKAIAANYASIAKAFVAKDFAAFGGFLSDDFTSTPPEGGSFNRDQVVKEFAGQRERLSQIKWTKRIKKIELDGSTAHVLAEGRMAAKIHFGKGKPHEFLLNATSQDDWVKLGEVWKLRVSKTTAFGVKIDGKPVATH